MLSSPTFLVVLERLGVDTIGVVDGTVPFRHSDTDGARTGQVSGYFKDKKNVLWWSLHRFQF